MRYDDGIPELTPAQWEENERAKIVRANNENGDQLRKNNLMGFELFTATRSVICPGVARVCEDRISFHMIDLTKIGVTDEIQLLIDREGRRIAIRKPATRIAVRKLRIDSVNRRCTGAIAVFKTFGLKVPKPIDAPMVIADGMIIVSLKELK